MGPIPTIGCCLLLSMAGHVFAISARFVGRAVLVKDGPHRITLPEVAEDHAIYTVIHSISRRGADYHLVIGCSNLSRGWPPRGGYCGSGIESYVEWLHIHEGKIVEQREGLYESCFRNRDGYSIAWKNGVLRWSVSGVDGSAAERM